MVRVKERYLLVNILYPPEPRGVTSSSRASHLLTCNQPTHDGLTHSVLLRAIKSEVLTLFGDYGAGAVERGLRIKYLSNATSTFILQCSRAYFRLAWSALTCMTRVPIAEGKPCIFRVVHVSGTIRKVEDEAIRRARLLVLAAKDEMAGRGNSALANIFGGSMNETLQNIVAAVADDGEDSDVDMNDSG